ncbi:hypothetical protein AN958_04261 [Leucoagaricus sp. SymC.cos]|nr:hypothetical protein AN958_04261 [Leucoagaricus sp. SymC.cos]
MFCITFTLFPKPPRQTVMALGKTRSRRDSFGLAVRPDGTLGIDITRETIGNPLASGSPEFNRQTNSSRPQLRQSESEPRRNLGSFTKKRRRRDSFGLEVREDGTLSLAQLVRVGSSDSRSAPRAETREDTEPGGDVGRAESNRASLDSNTSWMVGSSSNTSRRRRRRRDSFGLEVREDGTLSLDGLVGHASSGGGEQSGSSRPQNQTTTASLGSNNPSSYTNSRERTRASMSGITRGLDGAYSQALRGARASEHSPELELLRARVRRLEAELAIRGRPPTRDSLDAPPAYQSRSGSPSREHRT